MALLGEKYGEECRVIDKGIAKKHDEDVLTPSASENIAYFLLALSHKTRVRILSLLANHDRTFRTLNGDTHVKKTALSNHLALLQERGLVKRVGHGSYSITEDGLNLLTSVKDAYDQSVARREDEGRRLIERFTQIRRPRKVTKELKVDIVQLEPMTIASVRAVGKSPEEDALKKLVAFAEPRGLLDNPSKHPVFGFNNPNPSGPDEEYGYEFWIRVDSKIEIDSETQLKKFDGGLYAVTRCNLTQEAQSEFLREHGQLESWYRLGEWVKSSQYKPANHQWLEKALNVGEREGDWFLDLYLPIKK